MACQRLPSFARCKLRAVTAKWVGDWRSETQRTVGGFVQSSSGFLLSVHSFLMCLVNQCPTIPDDQDQVNVTQE